MRKYKFTGIFKNSEGHVYEAKVICNGLLQAFFLLTADAIRSGKHYQLHSITDEKDNVTMVDNISKISSLLLKNN